MLAQVFYPVVALFEVGVGGVDALVVHGAAGGGEVYVPPVDADAVASGVDLGDRRGLEVGFAGVKDAPFVQASLVAPEFVGVAAGAVDGGESGGFAGASVCGCQHCQAGFHGVVDVDRALDRPNAVHKPIGEW